jgi:hypothetical protein
VETTDLDYLVRVAKPTDYPSRIRQFSEIGEPQTDVESMVSEGH